MPYILLFKFNSREQALSHILINSINILGWLPDILSRGQPPEKFCPHPQGTQAEGPGLDSDKAGQFTIHTGYLQGRATVEEHCGCLG